MQHVTGIGGLFFRSKNPAALGEWYKEHFGIELVPSCGNGANTVGPASCDQGIPFQAFHKNKVSPVIFWLTATLVGGFILWLLYRTAACSFRSFRQRIIHVDAIVFFAALLFAVLVIAWIYPPR